MNFGFSLMNFGFLFMKLLIYASEILDFFIHEILAFCQ